MAASPEYRAFVEDLLEPLGPVESRRMFGGLGVFYRGVMFALVAQEQLYLKVDEHNRGDFEAAGMQPFSYQRAGATRSLKSYWRLPDDVVDDSDAVLTWARAAVDAALRADAAKTR